MALWPGGGYLVARRLRGDRHRTLVDGDFRPCQFRTQSEAARVAVTLNEMEAGG